VEELATSKIKEETANNRLRAMGVGTLPTPTERQMMMMINLEWFTPHQGATWDKQP
jgi:hypothetical protein